MIQAPLKLRLDLPESARRALCEQLARFEGVMITDDKDALPVTADMLSPRLGSTLARLHQMIFSPLKPVALGECVLHPAQKTLSHEKSGLALPLTERECDILRHLADGPATREELLSEVFGYHHEADTHALETHIYRLRQKLDGQSATQGMLATVDGGYALAPLKE